MVPTLETKISSPSAIIKIVTDVQSEKNVEYFRDCSKELEKGGREYKESSSTQTSSSSSLLHKRKVHSYYDLNGFRKTSANCKVLLNRPKKHMNTVSQRIISAKFLRVKQLQNELTEAQKKISDLQEENRTLKNIHKRQDSALRKYDSQDSHLPQLLKSHEEEMRIITLKYKKLRSGYTDLESRYNKQYSELITMKDRYNHLLIISRDKHLLQREQLTKQKEEMKIVISDLKNRIKLQSRRLDLEAKNHKYQLSIEFSKQKSLLEKLRQSEENVQKLQSALKEKDKYMANNKINQQNKMHQMKLKLPTNSLNPIRKCSNHEGENFKITISNGKKKNSANFPKVVHKMDELLAQGNTEVKNNLPNEHDKREENFQEKQPECSLSLRNEQELSFVETERLSDTFLHSQKSIEHNYKSDNNNNIKQILDLAVTSDLLKSEVTPKNTVLEKYSLDLFDSYEKNSHDETSSEKSEDFEAAKETISWLEFHEKIKDENEWVDQKWDLFCDTFSPQKCVTIPQNQTVEPSDYAKSNSQNFNPKVFNAENESSHEECGINIGTLQNSRNVVLSDHKKLTLLSALRQIDLEKNNSNDSGLISNDRNAIQRKSKKSASRANSLLKNTVQ